MPRTRQPEFPAVAEARKAARIAQRVIAIIEKGGCQAAVREILDRHYAPRFYVSDVDHANGVVTTDTNA